MTLPADPIPGPDTTVPVPPIEQPVPVKEPEPDRLPDEEPCPIPMKTRNRRSRSVLRRLSDLT
jgi:hypothetical protein